MLYKYRLEGGMHIDIEGNRYRKGDIIETDERLDQIHGKEFVRVHVDELIEEPVKKVEEEKPVEKIVEKPEEKKRKPAEKEVDFEGAFEANLVVKKTAKGSFNVYTPEGNRINKRALSKAKAEKLVLSYLEEEEEE